MTMPLRHTAIVLGIVFLVVLSGCAGLGVNDDDDAAGVGPDDDAAADVDDSPTDDSPDDLDDSVDEPDAEMLVHAPHDRDLIQTGMIELTVDDADEAGSAVRESVREAGGFVSESSQERHAENDETWTTETIVIRVPSEAFGETMAELEALGSVERTETDTEDVTDQLVDLDARIENLDLERDRLRALFDEANETDAVLAIQRELSDVQEEIERLSAQRASLEDRVAYATITIHLAEEDPSPLPEPAEPAWYETTVPDAFLHSVEGVAVTLRAIAVGIAFVAPYAMVFGTPFAAVGGVYWYRSAKRSEP